MKPEVFKMTHRAGHHLTLDVLVPSRSSSPAVSPRRVSLHSSEAPDSFPPWTVPPPGARLSLPSKGLHRLTPPHLSGVRLSDSSSKTPSLAPPPDRTEEESLLSLQVLNEESSDCKEEVKFLPTATTPKKPLKQKTRWNGLRCAYMMVTFLFVSYNKGDWCYCHYCNPEVDNRNNPCCAF
ncbi:epididymal protein 13 [Dama dama]